MDEEIKEKYEELAKEYGIVMVAVRETIPQDILGKSMMLNVEDYRAIATGLFIEAHINRKGNGNGQGKYEGPATDAAKKFLKILISERKDATNIVASFKDANGIEDIEDISATHCSTLIDMLKTLKKA